MFNRGFARETWDDAVKFLAVVVAIAFICGFLVGLAF